MTARTSPATLTPLLGFPEVRVGDDVADFVLKALQDNGIQLRDGDILVVSSKVASKAMGLRAPADQVTEVVRSQTRRIVAERMTPAGITRVVESAAGPVIVAAGVDSSNSGSGTTDEATVLVLPVDPDAVAAQIRERVQNGWEALSGTRPRLGVILSDTSGRPWRIGQTDFALGASGIHLIDDLRGSADADGRRLAVTERCVADEIAAAADLVKGKVTGVPAAHIRGLAQHVGGESTAGARDLVRTGPSDWFGYGMVEAVRAALGVEPGSATALEVGIPAIGPEDVATRAARALRVALLTCPEASADINGDTVRLVAPEDFILGVAATRAELALHGEGLTTTLMRLPDPTPTHTPDPTRSPTLGLVLATGAGLTTQPSVLIVFQ